MTDTKGAEAAGMREEEGYKLASQLASKPDCP